MSLLLRSDYHFWDPTRDWLKREGELIHARKVVHETLDGETIVIHLETGSYYSLTGSGAEIWTLVGAGASAGQLCAELARRHQRDEDEIRGDVERFVAELERDGLVEPSDVEVRALPEAPSGSNGWASPRLERYDDMRDFLLVDPIHEVDAAGWPKVSTAPGER